MYEWDKYKTVPFEQLKGKTIDELTGCEVGSEVIEFDTKEGPRFRLKYHQDCCANCSVEEIIGDIQDLIGTPILLAEEVSSNEPDKSAMEEREAEYKKDKENYEKSGNKYYYKNFEDYCKSRYESETWVFYKLSTIKGSVTLRWYGSSNGYYSESATFEVEVATLPTPGETNRGEESK